VKSRSGRTTGSSTLLHSCSFRFVRVRPYPVASVHTLSNYFAIVHTRSCSFIFGHLRAYSFEFAIGHNRVCSLMLRSRDSSVGIATGYELDDRSIGVGFPAGAANFSFHHRVQTGFRAHQAFCPMGTGVLSLGVKRPGR
jgi:hypothetical protein